jgi:PhnB protein
MAFHPYLFFSGNCREAFTHYQEIFGGELVLLPMSDLPAEERPGTPAQAELIMHAALKFEDHLLMASDDPTGDAGPVKGMSVNFNALSAHGTVTMPIAETFWSPKFGMCLDRFGVPWMISTDAPTQAA